MVILKGTGHIKAVLLNGLEVFGGTVYLFCIPITTLKPNSVSFLRGESGITEGPTVHHSMCLLKNETCRTTAGLESV